MWSVVPVKFCGDCGIRVDPGFACSGPCGRSFHRLCADIDRTCLDAMAVNPGMMWFCRECQQEVRQRPPSIPGVESYLPPEVWERIFMNLKQAQLLHVRETCRYWRNVVDGSRKLLDTLTVYFPSYFRMDCKFIPKHLFPAEATRAVWDKELTSEIDDVEAWWPPFGTRLTEIILGECVITLEVLLTMLRHTPNLVRLMLRGMWLGIADKSLVDFQLNKMREFSIKYPAYGDSLDVFAKLFPFLTNFYYGYMNEDVFNFVSTLQRTLIHLELNARGSVLAEIGNLEHLKLKKVSLCGLIENSVVLQFCAAQSSLAEIYFSSPLSDDVLCSIGQFCPNLTRFSGKIGGNVNFVPSFLNTMTKLEYLYMMSEEGENYLAVDFTGIKNVHLAKVILCGIEPIAHSLQQYFQNAPKLTFVIIQDCFFRNWSLVFDTLLGVKLLRDLFINVNVEEDDTLDFELRSFDYLERLELCCSAVLNRLLDECPNVKELIFIEQFAITREMKSLKILSIFFADITETDAQDIVKYCRELQELEITEVSMSEYCKALLEQAFGRKLIVNYEVN